MDKRLEEYFVKQYPHLFRDFGGDMRVTCMAWGCDCGNGWFHLMNAAFNVAEHPGATLLQVKEKFGGLCLYRMTSSKPDFIELTKKEYNKISVALDTAEDRSYQVCENCGAPGKVRRGGRVSTLCDRCHRLNYGAAVYEDNVRDELWNIGDATGDKIARKLGLRTTCVTYKDHYVNQKNTDCVICKEILRVVLPTVKQEEDKAAVVDCPQDNCDGKITKVSGSRDWLCDTCNKKVRVAQVVYTPPKSEKITAMNCPNCEGELGEPDWTCNRCGIVVNITKQPEK